MPSRTSAEKSGKKHASSNGSRDQIRKAAGPKVAEAVPPSSSGHGKGSSRNVRSPLEHSQEPIQQRTSKRRMVKVKFDVHSNEEPEPEDKSDAVDTFRPRKKHRSTSKLLDTVVENGGVAGPMESPLTPLPPSRQALVVDGVGGSSDAAVEESSSVGETTDTLNTYSGDSIAEESQDASERGSVAMSEEHPSDLDDFIDDRPLRDLTEESASGDDAGSRPPPPSQPRRRLKRKTEDSPGVEASQFDLGDDEETSPVTRKKSRRVEDSLAVDDAASGQRFSSSGRDSVAVPSSKRTGRVESVDVDDEDLPSEINRKTARVSLRRSRDVRVGASNTAVSSKTRSSTRELRPIEKKTSSRPKDAESRPHRHASTGPGGALDVVAEHRPTTPDAWSPTPEKDGKSPRVRLPGSSSLTDTPDMKDEPVLKVEDVDSDEDDGVDGGPSPSGALVDDEAGPDLESDEDSIVDPWLKDEYSLLPSLPNVELVPVFSMDFIPPDVALLPSQVRDSYQGHSSAAFISERLWEILKVTTCAGEIVNPARAPVEAVSTSPSGNSVYFVLPRPKKTTRPHNYSPNACFLMSGVSSGEVSTNYGPSSSRSVFHASSSSARSGAVDPIFKYIKSGRYPPALGFTEQVPILDARGRSYVGGRFGFDKLLTLSPYPRFEVAMNSIVTIGFTANTYANRTGQSKGADYLSLNVQFVVVHADGPNKRSRTLGAV